MRIFFAGPLTNLKNPETTKIWYQQMSDMTKSLGHDYFWAFLNGTDPVINPEVSSKEVYQRDIDELEKSDIMIAYVGEPTTGTGIEIEHAKYVNKPVVLLYEKGAHVSRMLRGCPSIQKEIVFASPEDALIKLQEYLVSYK